jgi:hypothetical protein
VLAQEVAAFERAHGTPEHYLAPAGDFDELREVGHDRRRVRLATEGES